MLDCQKEFLNSQTVEGDTIWYRAPCYHSEGQIVVPLWLDET